MPRPTALRNWLDARSRRERVLLSAALALGVIWLAVAIVWQPLLRQRAALIETMAGRDRMLAVLETEPLALDAAALDDRPVPVIVTESSAAFGLVIRRIEPDGAGTRIVLAEAPFDDVIRWVAALEHDHGLVLDGIEMTRQPAPGVVGATLSLTR